MGMLSFLRSLSYFAHTIGALLLGFIVIITLYQIFTRPLGLGSIGIEEISGILVVWAVYLTIPYALREKKHIRVDIVLRLLSEKNQKRLLIVGNFICLIFCIVIIWHGLQLTLLEFQGGGVTPLLNIPVYLLYLAVPLGMFLFALEASMEIITHISGLKSEDNVYRIHQ